MTNDCKFLKSVRRVIRLMNSSTYLIILLLSVLFDYYFTFCSQMCECKSTLHHSHHHHHNNRARAADIIDIHQSAFMIFISHEKKNIFFCNTHAKRLIHFKQDEKRAREREMKMKQDQQCLLALHRVAFACNLYNLIINIIATFA